jgi:hypothetical protein
MVDIVLIIPEIEAIRERIERSFHSVSVRIKGGDQNGTGEDQRLTV